MSRATDLELAIKAAKAAGDALAGRGAEFQGVDAEIGRDIKLKADKAAEAIILDILQTESEHTILAEEGGWQGEPSESAWVVDPLDGSSNYFREIPLCAVSIGLIENRKPIVGVIYDFNSGDLYAGAVGEGAALNGAPMRVSDIEETRRATLMTGIPHSRNLTDDDFIAMAHEHARWKKVRMIGTAALAGAYVAAGKADRYAESAMLWDIAASCALIEAAGGRAIIGDGPLDGSLTVLGDNGKLPL